MMRYVNCEEVTVLVDSPVKNYLHVAPSKPPMCRAPTEQTHHHRTNMAGYVHRIYVLALRHLPNLTEVCLTGRLLARA